MEPRSAEFEDFSASGGAFAAQTTRMFHYSTTSRLLEIVLDIVVAVVTVPATMMDIIIGAQEST